MINHITRKPYKGRNLMVLQLASANSGFKSNEWITFLQARNNGLAIKKGARGVSIMLVTQGNKKKTDDKEENISIRYAGKATVFNLDQTQPVETTAKTDTATPVIKIQEPEKEKTEDKTIVKTIKATDFARSMDIEVFEW